MDNDHIQQLKTFRRELHAHPELSGEEQETAEKIAQMLGQLSPSRIMTGLGGTGVLAEFDSGKEGPGVLFRSELDALPITEENKFEYRSQNAQVSHKCGHDGHMAILMGLAMMVSENPPARGRILVLFQPAEETGAGAEAVLKDKKFDEFHPDLAFALHNIPGYAKHEIIVKEGPFTSSVRSPVISLTGKTSHAGEPEHGANPAWAIAEMITALRALSNNDPEREDFTLITPIYLTSGEKAYGTAAGEGELHLTIRTWTKAHMEKLKEQVMTIVQQVAKGHGLAFDVRWTNPFRTNRNDPEAVQVIRDAARDLGLSVTNRSIPFRWGEDFGIFTHRFKGAMFGLGAGEKTPALHNPDYDFPDELINTGIRMFYAIMQKTVNP